jgi:hypothetical protein
MFDSISKGLKILPAYAGGTISTDTDTSGAIVVDTQGYENEVVFVGYSGAITDGTYKLEINQTDNADGTTDAAEVGSYLVQESFVAASDATTKRVGARLSKRYAVLNIASSGTTSGGVFKGAIAILNPKVRPVA